MNVNQSSVVLAYAAAQGITLVEGVNHSNYDFVTNTISMQVYSSDEEYCFALLHELGHASQPVELMDNYEVNPIPAEEDAWVRAEQLHVELLGSVSNEFYVMKAQCLAYYYTKVAELVESKRDVMEGCDKTYPYMSCSMSYKKTSVGLVVKREVGGFYPAEYLPLPEGEDELF